MTHKTIKIQNSTIIPVPKPITLEIDLDTNVLELKKHIRDELELPDLNYLVFLYDGHWIVLENDEDKLSQYPFQNKGTKLEVRRTINLDLLHKLKDELKQDTDAKYPYGVLHVRSTSAEETKKKLVEITKRFIDEALRDPSNVSFSIPSRSGDNIGFDEISELVLLGRQKTERQFRSLGSVKSVQQLTRLMSALHLGLSRNLSSTKRDLFYSDVNTFESQNTSDNLIEDVGAMLNVTRSSLNVTASSKGLVVGHIEFKEKNHDIDCKKIGYGHPIPADIGKISDMQSDAEFVLVIEKDAIYNRLQEDQFYDYIPSILVTAKGQPDMATRMFLKKINEELNLPILALMDADIYGFEILRVYSVGSKALSFEAANLAVPNIKWLGLLPSDLKEDSGYNIPSVTHIKMTKSDERRTKLLLEEEFVKRKPAWTREIKSLMDQGIKAEIQALYAIDPQYITNHYLPMKIESGDFI